MGPWLREALDREVETGTWVGAPPLDGAHTAEVVVVGGGYTGLWTALRLRESGVDVALVEGSVCGAGASGRNAGFAIGWWERLVELEETFGTAAALALADAADASLRDIRAFVEERGWDVGWREEGCLWIAESSAQAEATQPLLDRLRALGRTPFEPMAQGELDALGVVAGVRHAEAAMVQPALLVRALRRAALDAGVRLYEHTPAEVGTPRRRSGPPRGRSAGDGGARIATPRGQLTAQSAVLATGAWAARHPLLRRHVLVTSSDAVLTAPAPDALAAAGIASGTGIADQRRMVHYRRPTADGRLVFGKGGGPVAFRGRIGHAFDGPSPRAEALEAAMRRAHPWLGDLPVVASWRGPVDLSVTGMPFFCDLGDGVHAGLGYSGDGIVPAALGGRILAARAVGRDDPLTELPIADLPAGRFPPEPLRWIGGNMLRRLIGRAERMDDAGLPAPGALSATIRILERLAVSG